MGLRADESHGRCGEASVASAIETGPINARQAARTRCGEASVASAIETDKSRPEPYAEISVAGKQASRLRLKLPPLFATTVAYGSCGEASVASAIETQDEMVERLEQVGCGEASVASAIETLAAISVFLPFP